MAKAAIIKPRSVIITTRYFWQKWRPLLGNSLAVLIIEARRKCYRNLETGEVRDWFYSTIDELAQSVGFSAKKIAQLLRRPSAEKFIRYKPTYIYSPELGKKVRGKCLFRVSLDDPLVPDDEVSLISQEIHKDVSFQNHSKAPFVPEVSTFEKPPTGQFDRNNYSTFQEINIDINNTTVNYSQKGGIIEAEIESLAMQNKQYQNPEKYDALFQEIKDEIGKDSILGRTILRSCFISEVRTENNFAIISIDAPNPRYRKVLDVCLRKKITMVLEQMIHRNVSLKIVNSNAGQDTS